MTTSDKKKENVEESNAPKVFSSGVISSEKKVSRRDFLNIATATLAATASTSLVSGCESEPQVQPTSTPGGPPVGTTLGDIPLFEQPGVESTILETLAVGVLVTILQRDKTESWFKVRTKEEKEGWVQINQIAVDPSFATTIDTLVPINYEIQALPTIEYIVVKGELNTRVTLQKVPGTTDRVVGKIDKNSIVVILERDSTDQWYKIRTLDNKEGWVKKSAVKLDAESKSTVNTHVKINYSVVPVKPPKPPSNPPSGGGGSHYWHPN